MAPFNKLYVSTLYPLYYPPPFVVTNVPVCVFPILNASIIFAHLHSQPPAPSAQLSMFTFL